VDEPSPPGVDDRENGWRGDTLRDVPGEEQLLLGLEEECLLLAGVFEYKPEDFGR
jgi:hypothetical protein